MRRPIGGEGRPYERSAEGPAQPGSGETVEIFRLCRLSLGLAVEASTRPGGFPVPNSCPWMCRKLEGTQETSLETILTSGPLNLEEWVLAHVLVGVCHRRLSGNERKRRGDAACVGGDQYGLLDSPNHELTET